MKTSVFPGAGSQADVVEVLWEDEQRAFCRFGRGDSELHGYVLMPTQSGAKVATDGIARLVHEHSLRDCLRGEWALRPIELTHEHGRTMMSVEYSAGTPLETLVGQPMEISSFLRLAVGLTATLGQLHRSGLIHRDLRPYNVLFDDASGRAWLTGFGIASPPPLPGQSSDPPKVPVGTLAYMSPEQSGRIERSVDARSDLYSLGVTLYQLATGSLPFDSHDPMELVHCHVARQAVEPSLRSPCIPSTVSAVIMKLLAKSPEDRYQSAEGAEADLRLCQSSNSLDASRGCFALASHDIPHDLRIPKKLYGRASDSQRLFDARDRIAQSGGVELLLVSGYSGVGKSSLVDELRKAMARSSGFFAAGKCEQLKRGIPYAALAQALRTLVEMLLRSGEPELAEWRGRVQEAIGANGQLILNLVPELEHIVGKQPAVEELPPQDSYNRFQLVFRAFIQAFASPENPLVLFLDDLQWIDSATLALVEDLLEKRNSRHLLLVGAYRENEVDAGHPLAISLERMRLVGATVDVVRLGPLELRDITSLVAGALQCDETRVQALARMLAEKTGGNPFFVVEFLNELAAEGMLTFDASLGTWTWSVNRILGKKYTDNVAHLMASKVSRLPEEVLMVLTDLACLGGVADVRTLASARAISLADVRSALVHATRAGMVIRLEGSYRFSHDRVQEAAYSSLTSAERAAAHLRIGRSLRADGGVSPTPDCVFAVVDQLNRALPLIIDQREKEELVRLNVRAALSAKAAVAYSAARSYLVIASVLQSDDAWSQRYNETLELYLNLAECEYLTGDFDAAESLFELMRSHSQSNIDMARICSLQMKSCQVGRGYDKSLKLALDALRAFGVTFPESDEAIRLAAKSEFQNITLNLGSRRIIDLLDSPLAESADVKAVMALLADSVPSAYNGNPKLLPLLVAKAVNHSLQYGNTEQSSYAYAVHALILAGKYGEAAQAFEYSEMAIRLNEQFGNRRLRGALLHLHGNHVNFWRRPFETGREILEQGFAACLEVGDLVYAGHVAFLSVWQAIERGDHLQDVLVLAQRNALFARQSRNEAIHQSIRLEQHFVLRMQGKSGGTGELEPALFDQAGSLLAISEAAFGCGLVLHRVMELIFLFHHGRYADALTAARLAEPMLEAAIATPIEATYHFFHALTLVAVLPALPENEYSQACNVLHDKLSRLRAWAENSPSNYQNRYVLLMAELARVEGRVTDAMGHYEEAILSSRSGGFLQNEGLALELAARFYLDRGFEQFAHTYLKMARDCYLRWGATGKVEHMCKVYPLLRDDVTRPLAYSNSPFEETIGQLDFETVLKVSEAISGEIVFDRLMDTLMRTAIEHAGAERGLLILSSGDEYRIEAEARVSQGGVVVDAGSCRSTVGELPESVLRYAIRTKEIVLLTDASNGGDFSTDPYVMKHRARSVLCLPILRQSRLLGLMYLENNLATHAFTPSRMSILKLVASQAAMSMENAQLYRGLAERESKIRRLVDANIVGIFIWDFDGRIIDANDAFLQQIGYSRDDLVAGQLRWTDLTPYTWLEREERLLIPQLKTAGSLVPFEKEYFRKDGSRVPVLLGLAILEENNNQGIAFALDLTERNRAAEALRDLQMELAHANRLSTMGQLVATIAHEVNQPIGATRNNANAALHFLGRVPPDISEVRDALQGVVNETYRAGNIVSRIRDQVKKGPPRKESVELNHAIAEVVSLVGRELSGARVTVRTRLSKGSALVLADRVQLQQVILNLILNAIEAMTGARSRRRELDISTSRSARELIVAIADSGPGVALEDRERIFESFYTTKAAGVGIGLSISRTILQAHGGRVWADANHPTGAVLKFSLPKHS